MCVGRTSIRFVLHTRRGRGDTFLKQLRAVCWTGCTLALHISSHNTTLVFEVLYFRFSSFYWSWFQGEQVTLCSLNFCERLLWAVLKKKKIMHVHTIDSSDVLDCLSSKYQPSFEKRTLKFTLTVRCLVYDSAKILWLIPVMQWCHKMGNYTISFIWW